MITRRSFVAGGLAAAASGRRPNIIFLLTDDHRWDALGCTGNRIIQTPHIDRLASDGVVFDYNFCTTAICMTSRASIFSGLHERSHGISSFATPFSLGAMSRTYPALLRAAGYRTGFIGKYGVGNDLPKDAFDYFEGFPGQGHYFPKEGGHLTALQGRQALEFIDGCKASQPFCLSVSFKAPHVQDNDPRQFLYDPADEDLYADVRIPVPPTANERSYAVLPPFLRDSESRVRWKLQFADPEMYQRSVKGYYRLITEVDRVVGSIVEGLRKRGDLDNTVIVFTGDNGYFLGEHGLSHKWYLYEESVRTPLVIWDPRLPAAARGRRSKRMTLNIDIAPTLLDIAGVKASAAMQGRSLTPLLAGDASGWRKDWFYSHLFKHPKIPRSEGVRNGRWTYIRWVDHDAEELFDIRTDPGNTRNLAASAPRELARMRERYRQWDAALKAWQPERPWRDPV